MKLVETTLGRDGVEYVRLCLARGKTLARYHLECLDLYRGKVLTYLPADISAQAAREFTTGGKIPQPAKSEGILVEEGGRQIVAVPVRSTVDHMTTLIEQFLRGGSGRLCILQHAFARPSDPWLSDSPARFLTFEDEVYFFITGQSANTGEIREAIGEAETTYLFIGALTSLRSGNTWSLERKEKVSLDELRTLAEKTETIFVGAYDGEGYLIWSRN